MLYVTPSMIRVKMTGHEPVKKADLKMVKAVIEKVTENAES